MREKKPWLIVAFDATVQAMAAEKICAGLELPGRLIPIPREITAGCGLAWKAPPEAQEQLTAALDGAGIRWSTMRVLML